MICASHAENNSTGSQRALDLCSFWLRRCRESHERCRSVYQDDTPPFKPKRLIDVSSSTVRLVVSSNETQVHEYVALSHCWGLVPIIRTLKANYKDHLLGIQSDKLSRTFNDAIHTTRVLGFRYIWIDSLCIVQDDPDDWSAEAATMCDVYSNATLTIAAAHAAGGDIGCFFERDGRMNNPFLMHLGTQPSHNSVCAWFATFGYIPLSPGGVHLPLLYGRAWVLQEQLLSSRMLIFNRHILQWECMTLHDSDAFPGGGGSHHSDAELEIRRAVKNQEDHFKKPIEGLADRDISDADLACYKADAWYAIVQSYTHRGMTNTTDRLVALAGIANGLGRHTTNRYQAGLWSQQLWRGLLWELSTIDQNHYFDLDRNGQIRQNPTLAPSWSWASVTAPVAFLHANPMIDCICDIVSCFTTDNVAAQTGYLQIRGHVRRGHVNAVYAYSIREAAKKHPAMSRSSPGHGTEMRNLRGQPYLPHQYFMFATKPPRHYIRYTAEHHWGWRTVRGEFHADEIIEPTTEVTFIAIAAWNQESRPGKPCAFRTETGPITVFSLALVPTGNAKHEYRRVGLAEWNRCAWFGCRCGYEPPGQNLRERRAQGTGGALDVRWKQRLRKLYRWPDLEFYQRNKEVNHAHKIEANKLPELTKYHEDVGIEEMLLTIV
jgi:hypothetical protein